MEWTASVSLVISISPLTWKINDRQFVIGDFLTYFLEGAIRQDAENSANYRLVRFAVGHHDHHLVGGVQEDPASSETSHHWRMSKLKWNKFFNWILLFTYRSWWRIFNLARLYSTRTIAKRNNNRRLFKFFSEGGSWFDWFLNSVFILLRILTWNKNLI